MTTTIFDMLKGMEDALRPPERLTVSQAAAKYRFLNNPGAYVGPWKNDTAPYLTEIMDTLDSRDYTACVLAASAQCGKPIWVETPVPTPDGWRRLRDIHVGDYVFALDGNPTRVIAETETFTGRDCFRITFDDGSWIVCDESHRWGVNDAWGNAPYELVTKTTRDLLDSYRIRTSKGTFRYRYAIPVAAPIEMPERELPIDPYVLGVWLGDGRSDGSYFTLGSQDAPHLVEQMRARGVDVSHFPEKGGNRNCDRVTVRIGGRPMITLLRGLGLRNNKHIPAEYLRASVKQRLELLRGLMDTDGTVDRNGRFSFSQSNHPMMEGVYELLVSLGYKVYWEAKMPTYTSRGEKKVGKQTQRLSFTAYSAESVTTLPRHIARVREHAARVTQRPTHSNRRFIRNIEPYESVPVRCIGVEHSSHLFLVGEQMVPTHNTDSILNWLLHTVICSPADFILYQTSQSVARDFSKRRVERLHRHSPAMKERLSPRSDDNNVFDLKYRSGMLFTLSWPTINELSGRPVGRVALTDYDRMPENVDGEGSPFDLAKTRTRTFGSFAMTFAESSPGFEIERASWVPSTPHEAPPTKGILSLYNRGDRRRWYWPCVHCGEFYEPDFHLLVYPETEDIIEAAEQAKMACPHCGALMEPGLKAEVNRRGVWLKDGQKIRPDGTVIGSGPRSDIASFWLKGVAAAFADWKTLVTNYLKAVQEFERTGSQEALKSTVNTDQGLPYLPRGLGQERLPEELKGRATALPQAVVPEGVRFLTATIDVQANRFSVQVTGTLAGGDKVVIDRFEIIKSQRYDEDGERLWLKPGAYPEDWEVLVPQVLDRSYPLGDGSGRRMMLRMVGCDSGGKGGTTANAYAFYRRLKRDGKHKRFRLIKGTSNEAAPRAAIGYPDAQKKDKLADARGDIPVLFLQVNKLKDQLNNMLDRTEPGGGMVIFADWLPDEFFTELTVEVRTSKGWENPKKYRNEAWDHLVYDLGLCSIMRADNFDWDNPPTWAGEWDSNPLVFGGEESRFEAKAKETYDLAKLGAALA